MSGKREDNSNFSFMNLANKLKNTGNLIGDATSRYGYKNWNTSWLLKVYLIKVILLSLITVLFTDFGLFYCCSVL